MASVAEIAPKIDPGLYGRVHRKKIAELRQLDTFQLLTEVVTAALRFNQRVDISIWDGTGIRCICVTDNAPADACLKGLGKLKPAGRGAFGQVYKACRDGKTIAIKVETLRPWRLRDKAVDLLRMIKIIKRAGELGIGPKVLDLYVCYKNWEHQLVISMDYISGRPWSEWAPLATRAAKEQALASLKTKLDNMHAAKLLHADLHGGNVMVQGTLNTVKDVIIVDYGLSKDLATAQAFDLDIDDFNALQKAGQEGLAVCIAAELVALKKVVLQ
ncbi:hypothetical protein ABBQ32_013354 [Trebouxia sp. C0010 RCD-2024]